MTSPQLLGQPVVVLFGQDVTGGDDERDRPLDDLECSQGSSMSGDIGVDAGDPAQRVRDGELVMASEMPVERAALLILLLYLDKRGRPKVRIHGRPRSDRKRRFLLSAVAPSTSTRHPREARPINWAQRGGLASVAGNRLLTPRPHFTAHHARLVTRWLLLRTALLFVRSAVRLVYAEEIVRGSARPR